MPPATGNPLYAILNNPWYIGPAGIDRSNPENAPLLQASIDQYQAAQQAPPVYRATVPGMAADAAPPPRASANTQLPVSAAAISAAAKRPDPYLETPAVGPVNRIDDVGAQDSPPVAPAVAQFMPSANDPNMGYGATVAHPVEGQPVSTRHAGGGMGTSFTGSGGQLPRADGGGYREFRDLIQSRLPTPGATGNRRAQ